MALVWACEKFHRYLYGLHDFKLETDHKPLIPLINGGDLNSVPLRCQRLLIQLMKYNPVAVFTSGKTLVVADTLSRQPLEHDVKDVDMVEEIEIQEKLILESWPISADKLDETRQASSTDSHISTAIKLTLKGWPKYSKDVPEFMKMMYESRYDKRIVIPDVMKKEKLYKIHLGHKGVNKSIDRAQSCVWWHEPKVLKTMLMDVIIVLNTEVLREEKR